ncbi:MAG: DUF3352 domain-containing protein [Candidatus Marinimicrobia bacterium]|nr:DUF3352 domain-containing protein [Candidatus Neomarinimicrobiota bacterium]
MKKHCVRGLIGGLLLLGCVGGVLAAPMNPERTEALFAATAAELDLGGDLFAYLEMEDISVVVLRELKALAALAAEEAPPAAQAVDFLDKLDVFLRAEGLHDVVGFGLSSKPQGRGLYAFKQFLAINPEAAELRFWRVMGREPRALAVLRAAPRGTALLVASDLRLDALWDLVQDAVGHFGGPAADDAFQTQLAKLKDEAGLDVAALIESLSGELALCLVLDRTATVALPMIAEDYVAPQPGLVLALGVQNDLLARTLIEQARRNGAPLEPAEVAGRPAHLLAAAQVEPVPFQPALVEADGMVLLASTPELLAAAVEALEQDNGLLAEPGYRALADRLPQENNGVTYVDEHFNRAIRALQTAQMQSELDETESALPAKLIERLYSWLPMGSAMGVRVVKPNGVASLSVGPTGGKHVVASLAAMPLGMMAGIAIPSFVAARSQSREAALMNQLRMVDAAKEQWAMEQAQPEGAEVTAADIQAYLYPGALEPLPGHVLEINPIGQSPVLTKPDGTTVTLY